MMTDRQINAFAAAIHEGRPDWQPPGIVAALRTRNPSTDPWQLMTAMIRRAANPANTTPALQCHDVDDSRIACRTHPGATVRTDGQCAGCWADHVGTTEPQPLRRRGVGPAPDVRAQLVAAIGAVSVPPTASEPTQQQARQPIPNNEAEVGCG